MSDVATGHDASGPGARPRGDAAEGQTCSAGLALFDGAESPHDLVGRADKALYAAKA
jgi:GGDEF domain-containing protein